MKTTLSLILVEWTVLNCGCVVDPLHTEESRTTLPHTGGSPATFAPTEEPPVGLPRTEEIPGVLPKIEKLPVVQPQIAKTNVALPVMEEAPADVFFNQNRSPFGPLQVNVKTFGENYNLQLQPAVSPLREGFRLQRTARNIDGLLVIEDVVDDASQQNLYIDSELGTVVEVKNDTVEGILTPAISLKVSIDGYHKAIWQQFDPYVNTSKDYKEIPGRGKRHQPFRILRDVVNVSPEIYVLVDSTLTSNLGDSSKVKDYLAIFWNGVNQRFATVPDPKVQLVLAGALIIDKSADEPFINENIFQTNFVYGEKLLNSLSDWLYLIKDQLPKYDLAFLMTGKNMADVSSGTLQAGVNGFAWKGAACVVSSANKRSYNTGVAEDLGASFAGVLTASHEVAHILGAPHDGREGAESCPWDNGYIMSYVPGKSNKVFFSPCSQRLMKDYVISPDAACLRTTTIGSVIGMSPKLPGELVTMDEQCRKITGQSGAQVSKSVSENSLCIELVCQWQEQKDNKLYLYTMSSGQPAAEGSACRSGGRCSNGLCK